MLNTASVIVKLKECFALGCSYPYSKLCEACRMVDRVFKNIENNLFNEYCIHRYNNNTFGQVELNTEVGIPFFELYDYRVDKLVECGRCFYDFHLTRVDFCYGK